MRVALAQLQPVVGDFLGNYNLIKEAYLRGVEQKADLVICPELSVTGYPFYDLVFLDSFRIGTERSLERIKQLTLNQKPLLAVGHPKWDERLRNSLSIFGAGKIIFNQDKTFLPVHDVFDESRYFESAKMHQLFHFCDERLAIGICEDWWGKYGDLVPIYEPLKPTMMVSLSASPFEVQKHAERLLVHQKIAKKLKTPLLYVNQTGATDEIIFDGRSFALNAKGEVALELASFEKDFAVVDTHALNAQTESRVDEIALLLNALELGIQEYFNKQGFKKAILGLSGGIDSAVVAVLAVRALGKENVIGVAMPGPYSSLHSLADAESLSANLGIRLVNRPIKFWYSAIKTELSESVVGAAKAVFKELTLENLQSRIRGLTLMTLSSEYDALVLSTANKSELALGYGTLYGDLVGALAPIGDVFKTDIYLLAQWINKNRENPIPQSTLTKPPSAELKPNQTDQDSLPPYPELDVFLRDYLEQEQSWGEMLKRYKNVSWFQSVLRKIEQMEYKRRQSPIVLKISKKAFGVGRRLPVAKKFDPFSEEF